MAATAMYLESACARLATLGLSALPVCSLLLTHVLCLPTHAFGRGTLLEHVCHIIACDCDILPKCVGLLGSRVQHWIQELQGVLPISLLLYILIHDWLLCIPQISVYQFSTGLNDFGSELSGWNKAAFNLTNVSMHTIKCG